MRFLSKNVLERALWTSVVLLNFKMILSETDWSKIDEICGVSYSDRIVGGTRASLGQVDMLKV